MKHTSSWQACNGKTDTVGLGWRRGGCVPTRRRFFSLHLGAPTVSAIKAALTLAAHTAPNWNEFSRFQLPGKAQSGSGQPSGCRCPKCGQFEGAAMAALRCREAFLCATSKSENAVRAFGSREGRRGVLKPASAMAHAIRTRLAQHFEAVMGALRAFPLLFDHQGRGQECGTSGGGASGSGNGHGGDGRGDGGGEFSEFSHGSGNRSHRMQPLRSENNTEDGDAHVGTATGAGARIIPPAHLEARRRYHCTSVELVDAQGSPSPASSWPHEFIQIRPGSSFSREDVEATMSRMFSTGWYDSVKAFPVEESDKGMKVVFQVQGFQHPPVSMCRFINVGPAFDGCSWHPFKSVPDSTEDLKTGLALEVSPGSSNRVGPLILEHRLQGSGEPPKLLQPHHPTSSSPRALCDGRQGFLSPHGFDDDTQGVVASDDAPLATILPKSRPMMKKCLLPLTVQREITNWLQQQQGNVTVETLATIKRRVEKWYHVNGYKFAKVKSFDGVVDGALQFNVVEGDITRLRIFHEDKGGRRTKGRTRDCVIRRELPTMVREGMQYNVGAGKAALHNIFQLRLFDKVQVTPQPDTELGDDGGVMLDVVVSEQPVKCAYVDTEWSFLTTETGRPDLSTLQPGGSLFVEHRNIAGLNRSVSGSVATTNVLQPQEDLRFKLEYLHPYLDGHSSSLNRSFRASCFNKRKLSAVFGSGHQPPEMWVDRAGIKLNVTENFTKRSKVMYGVVVEEVATRDEASVIRGNSGAQLSGDRRMADGGVVDVGGSGVDHLVFLQTKITRDNTSFVNGTQIGARDVFQVDQGIGIGRTSPMFNRHNLGMTRFMLLGKVPVQSHHPPCVLILHGRYGGCVGDVPRYHSFTSGGPYALRAQNEGELTGSRQFLELAAEVRFPVQKSQVYGYVETGADLSKIGSSVGLWRRVRRGCYGAGVYLGPVRAEYVVEPGSDTGCFKVCFGERW